jgi:glycosyltransferase involved in cell wall biosynthesis
MWKMDCGTVAERNLSVLQMLPALDGGGVEQGTMEIAGALHRAGHQALVMSAGGRMVPALEALGAEHFQWRVDSKRPWTFRLVRPLQKFLRERQVDVLHLRSRMPAWIGWMAWRGMPVNERPRLVTTVHGFYSVNRYSAIMTRGERTIAVSNAIRDHILTRYPAVEPERLVVIPRGVDPALFNTTFTPSAQWRKQWDAQFPQTKGKQLVTLIGRLTRLKGHEDFITLVRRLCEAGVPIHGVVVGGEHPGRVSYAKSIRKMARYLPVTFTGHRTDAREIMSHCDLVVSLSAQPESFGRTVVEALSLGTPVLGYDHGGVGEILANIYPDGRVALGDIEALTKHAIKALSDPIPTPITHPYHLDNMLNATLDVYRNLAISGPTP